MAILVSYDFPGEGGAGVPTWKCSPDHRNLGLVCTMSISGRHEFRRPLDQGRPFLTVSLEVAKGYSSRAHFDRP